MSESVGSLSLTSKVALVTGAARGIGRSVALTLARHGADVVVTDIHGDAALLDAVVHDVAQLGRRSLAVTADLVRKEQVDRLVGTAVSELGRVDILVNNAGVHSYPSPLLTVTETEWDRVLDINVKGPLFTSQAVLPHMVERGSGVIVNIASDSAFDVIPDEGPYGISKIALVRMSSYFAKELAGKGVRVNALAPGWVRTRLTEQFMTDPALLEALLNGVPCRRVAEPDDIAGVVVFLASDLANYVNGHCLVVDGGRIAGVPA
jgi:NAD(P)-dependent dehydrogenase (short-subunit alcohol dehydrogenase family)